MSDALEKFRAMCDHRCPDGVRVVFANRPKMTIDIRCSCGDEWRFRLWTELKLRKPEGYVEWLFEDERKRKGLEAFVNGVLVGRDERKER